ncbi:MAG TPA: sigma-70 family RNA polymerase sigma factor [Tepidiformaceae bacterium]|nr:sigma-70 family RNA polymerase sigma factor [Tepidiformaceae bacterium]
MVSGQVPADDQLISLSKDGNLAAFNTLVERYQGPLFSLCVRLIGSREAAEDATQEAFLSVYRNLHRFEGGNVRSWLFRIAANECKDELRRRSRKDLALSLDRPADDDHAALDVADSAPGLQRLVEQSELARAVHEAIAALPEDQRLVILLVDLHGFDYHEVATITGAALGTVKSRVSRARARLREYFLANPELVDAYRRLEK